MDCATIASPATTHAELAGRALERGVHVLVEKPLALSVEAADIVLALAEEAGLVVQVGHQEAYVARAISLLDGPSPRSASFRRLNAFSGRALDVSVVMDLMIHDLDLAARLAGTAEASMETCRARAVHGVLADEVEVSLRFENGMTAQLHASRLAQTPCRDLLLEDGQGSTRLDFLTRTVEGGGARRLRPLGGEDAPLALHDPLAYGCEAFLAAVRGEATPGVTGREGRDALALALIVERAAEEALA